MAGTLSDVLENELLDHVFAGSAYTSPTNVYMALGKTAASDAAFTEIPDANGYARTAIAFGTPAASGSISNTTEITIGVTATADWDGGTPIAYFGIFDSATYGGGVRIAQGSLDTAKAVLNGDTAKFPVGSITITLD